jgi:hypothetical protein
MLLVIDVGLWRNVKVVMVGDVVRGLFARVFVWGDVDPHSGGLGVCELSTWGLAICCFTNKVQLSSRVSYGEAREIDLLACLRFTRAAGLEVGSPRLMKWSLRSMSAFYTSRGPSTCLGVVVCLCGRSRIPILVK